MNDVGAITAGATALCANCHAPLTGPYCAACGQPRDVHRRSVFGLLKDFIQDIASFDSRILRTARALMLQPGELVCSYREGRTQPFVPPVRLYLFVSLLFFIGLSLSHLALVQLEVQAKSRPVSVDDKGVPYVMADGKKVELSRRYAGEKLHFTFDPAISFFTRLGSRHSSMSPQAMQAIDDRMKAESVDKSNSRIQTIINGAIQKLATNPAALNSAITEWVSRMLFLLLPLFALLLALFYVRRREFYFVDHLVFSLNFHSFGFVLLLLAAGAAQILSGGTVALGMFGLMALYLWLAMRHVYRQGWVKTSVKFAVVGTVYCLFFIFPAFITILAFSVFGVGEAS